MAFWKRDVFSALDWEGNRTTLLGWVASEERKEEEEEGRSGRRRKVGGI